MQELSRPYFLTSFLEKNHIIHSKLTNIIEKIKVNESFSFYEYNKILILLRLLHIYFTVTIYV